MGVWDPHVPFIIEPEHTALREAARAMNWEAVGQLLEQNVPVTKLWHFAIGEFGDTGVARLAAALAKNTMLKELDFDNGSYGDSGITAKGAARLALALETPRL